MRALITGALGFVGKYLAEELLRRGCEVFGLDRREGPGVLAADLLDAPALSRVLRDARPDRVFHLAGLSSVALSWKEPRRAMEQNVLGAVNLLEALRRQAPGARAVLVGSSDEYGPITAPGGLVDENEPLRPQSPYAVSKLAQEELAKVYCRAYGLSICMTRSFNHSGPGQREGFLIPDLCAGLVRVERGLSPAVRVGNLDAKRDYTDVRDIVRAYCLLAERGASGEVYNVGSGRAVSGREILTALTALGARDIPVERDPARMRPADVPVICSDSRKLRRATGWAPEIPLETTLRDTLEYYRKGTEKR